ncbi:hypothetical protein [Methanococcus vannielii]|nr:hypothetical protein [Methanococcus vannielii]
MKNSDNEDLVFDNRIVPNSKRDFTTVGINCPNCNFFIKVSISELLTSEITCPACNNTMKLEKPKYIDFENFK